MAYINIGQSRLYYQQSGKGSPLLMIHGDSLDHNQWQEQYQYFAKNYRVITYDMAGYGKSSVPTKPVSHVQDLVGLLKALNLAQVNLIGSSLGGEIAIDLAVLHPQRVASLILVDSSLSGYYEDVDWGIDKDKQSLREIKQSWLENAVFRKIAKYPEKYAGLTKMVNGYLGIYWLKPDLRKRVQIKAVEVLNEITAPTLIMVGKDDLDYFRHIGLILNKGIRNSQLELLPGLSHLPNMENSDKFNLMVSKFLLSINQGSYAKYES